VITVEVNGRAIPRFSRSQLAAFVRRAIRAVERADAAPFQATEISIAFVDDGQMKSLNRRFRGKNRTTDVLTFGADPAEADASRPLGEIVISREQAGRQAKLEHHSVGTEVRYLLVHGILHAFGYDHESDRGEMNALELTVREAVGLR
jgi:probable rRNA maturation factor